MFHEVPTSLSHAVRSIQGTKEPPIQFTPSTGVRLLVLSVYFDLDAEGDVSLVVSRCPYILSL